MTILTIWLHGFNNYYASGEMLPEKGDRRCTVIAMTTKEEEACLFRSGGQAVVDWKIASLRSQ
jgi:hypothetical protein